MGQGVQMGPLLTLIANILKPLIGIVTKEFRDDVSKWVVDHYQKALATDNPWDDLFFEFLAKMLSVDLPS